MSRLDRDIETFREKVEYEVWSEQCADCTDCVLKQIKEIVYMPLEQFNDSQIRTATEISLYKKIEEIKNLIKLQE